MGKKELCNDIPVTYPQIDLDLFPLFFFAAISSFLGKRAKQTATEPQIAMHYIAICIYKDYNDFVGDDIADTSDDTQVSRISSTRNSGVEFLSVET